MTENIKREKLELLEAKKAWRDNLPHKYGWKNYKWAREFLEDNSRTLLLCAANQISKSSTQIRKVITLATETNEWPKFFRRTPRIFWYLYPTATMATTEFRSKWVPDFLPRGDMKKHPQFGWREEYRNRGDIFAIHFNTGVSVYFKTYAQDVQHLQASSVDYIATDEELPIELFDEISFRRMATDGMFSMVFTATLGQDEWRRAVEPGPQESRFLPEARVWQVSMFDCMRYEDGTPSHWTTEKIQRVISLCRSDAEVQRRVYGKFIKDSGLKYPGFDRGRNVIPPFHIPSNWVRFSGVDLGAGGQDNHPSTITFIAVRPDYRYGVVYRHWRGDNEHTTMTDVANKYIGMREYDDFSGNFYDYHSKEFKLVTDRMGLTFMPADKGHEIGEQVINALFKNKMLDIFAIPETEPLIREIMTLALGVDKRHAQDDSVDSMRYGVTRIPWDWSFVGLNIDVGVERRKVYTPIEVANIERAKDLKRMIENKDKDGLALSVEQEIDEWNEFFG